RSPCRPLRLFLSPLLARRSVPAQAARPTTTPARRFPRLHDETVRSERATRPSARRNSEWRTTSGTVGGSRTWGLGRSDRPDIRRLGWRLRPREYIHHASERRLDHGSQSGVLA